MSKKILDLLKMISKNIKASENYSEELLNIVAYDEADLLDINEELENLEASRNVNEDELDILRALLVYLLLRDTSYGKEEIYSLIFGKGKRIIWN